MTFSYPERRDLAARLAGQRVCVVGAGIIGVSTACFLAEEGFDVTVMDPHPPGEGGPSRANAAQIVPSLIYPLASPGTLMSVSSPLFRRDSPLSVPLRYALPIAPWLLAFVRASTKSRFDRAVKALTTLNGQAYPCFDDLLQRTGAPRILRRCGMIQLYESDRSLERGFRTWSAVPTELSGGAERIDDKDLRELEPALVPSFAGGILLPNTGVLSDPLEAVRAMATYAASMRVKFERARVGRVKPNGRTVSVTTSTGETAFGSVVVAAGVHAKPLLRQLSEPVRLESERGYNITVPCDARILRHALVFAERGVVATQIESGVRLGGLDELGGIALPPNPKLFSRVRAIGREVLPSLHWDVGVEWMGHRPSLPDTLPVIGPSRKHNGVFYAFGHGHLGMTQGPITGKIIAAMIAGTKPICDTSAFAIR